MGDHFRCIYSAIQEFFKNVDTRYQIGKGSLIGPLAGICQLHLLGITNPPKLFVPFSSVIFRSYDLGGDKGMPRMINCSKVGRDQFSFSRFGHDNFSNIFMASVQDVSTIQGTKLA